MRLVWKGKLDSMDQIPLSELPGDAVVFREPKTPAALNAAACLFVLPALALAAAAMIVKGSLYGDFTFLSFPGSMAGLLLSLLIIFPHELLHAVAFPKEAEVQVWYSLRHMIAFVYSGYPISKARFVFLSLLPNLVFGVIPLALWALLPVAGAAGGILLSFGSFSLLMGCGDYLNVFNALVQMPKGTVTQLSGFHSYWYYPSGQRGN